MASSFVGGLCIVWNETAAQNIANGQAGSNKEHPALGAQREDSQLLEGCVCREQMKRDLFSLYWV